jgi:signal transduction histidine kinase
MSHIAALVRSAYLPARRDAGSDAGPPPPSSLASAITSALDVLAPRARSRGIDINLELDASTRGVPADEIYAVVSNAVRNSIEAIGQTGRIDVRARLDEGHVLIEVLDNGVGPPLDAPRAFELGYSTKPGSSGIGLALAGEVITELRGVIELLPRSLSNPERPGAILRARYPILPQHTLPFRE